MIVQAQLELLDGSSKTYTLAIGQSVVLGRGTECGIVVSDSSVSRRHAKLELRPGGRLYVTDLGSTNGILIEGGRVPAGATVPVGGEGLLRLGACKFRLTLEGKDDDSEHRRAEQQAEDLALLPPGEFEVLGLVGSGGMGNVYAARQRSGGRSVVIKVLKPEANSDAESRRRFETEARIGMRVDSRFVARVYELRVLADRAYHVAEFLAGQSLAQRIRDSGPLSVPEVVRLGAEVATGLAAIHRAGAVHRDVKPGNVVLTEDRAVLTDFGIAKDLLAKDPTTRVGTVWGTMGFLAPELLRRGGELTPSADVFGLGVTIYMALSGRFPFQHKQPQDYLTSVEAGPAPLHQVAPGAPLQLTRLVTDMLSLEPADRPADGAAAAEKFALLVPTANRIHLGPKATERLRAVATAEIRQLDEKKPGKN